MRLINGRDELAEVLGPRPGQSDLKVIDALDEHCVTMLGHSPLAVFGYLDEQGRARATVVGGRVGFIDVQSPETVTLRLPDDVDPVVDTTISLVFLLPGLGETLRINGRVDAADGPVVGLTVDEAFVHCAKCVIRSKLWTGGAAPETDRAAGGEPEDGPLAAPGVHDFLGRSPFAVITSRNGHGDADASPKGDPPGFLRALDGATIAVPDRPGNHRADTHYNVIAEPAVALVALVPGEDQVLEITGRAALTDDADLLASMTVKGKDPKVAFVIDVDEVWLRPAPEVGAARLWDPGRRLAKGTLPKMSEVWTDHVRLNLTAAEIAAAEEVGINAESLEQALDTDYATNLY